MSVPDSQSFSVPPPSESIPSPVDNKMASSHGFELIHTGDAWNAKGSELDLCPEIAMAAVDQDHAVI